MPRKSVGIWNKHYIYPREIIFFARGLLGDMDNYSFGRPFGKSAFYLGKIHINQDNLMYSISENDIDLSKDKEFGRPVMYGGAFGDKWKGIIIVSIDEIRSELGITTDHLLLTIQNREFIAEMIADKITLNIYNNFKLAPKDSFVAYARKPWEK